MRVWVKVPTVSEKYVRGKFGTACQKYKCTKLFPFQECSLQPFSLKLHKDTVQKCSPPHFKQPETIILKLPSVWSSNGRATINCFEKDKITIFCHV